LNDTRKLSLPLGLYVHFPWCVSKCPYCDFNSHALRGQLPATDYVDVLIDDMQRSAAELNGRTVESIFLGGGTPSLFSASQMQRLLDAVRDNLTLAHHVEITMEANPGALEHAEFRGYREAGINRLSLGVQSLSDAKLKALGRIHSADDARAAFSEARAAGFDNINLDLMYGLPDQSLEEALTDVDGVLALQPDHVSHYHLTLEPNTVFYTRPPPLPDDDLMWDMQMACAEKLSIAGYANYEVSAWGQPGKESRHNLNYWRFGDYLGIGAGAHGKLTSATGEIWREVRPPNPRAYQLDSAPARQQVGSADLCFEFMLNNLRLAGGFQLHDFELRTGLPSSSLRSGLDMALGRGLLEEPMPGLYRPTALGFRFLDDLQGIFLPEPAPESAE